MQQKQATKKEAAKPGQMTQVQMLQKKFEFENEIIEEELYQFSEAEIDKMFADKPWKNEYSNSIIISIFQSASLQESKDIRNCSR